MWSSSFNDSVNMNVKVVGDLILSFSSTISGSCLYHLAFTSNEYFRHKFQWRCDQTLMWCLLYCCWVSILHPSMIWVTALIASPTRNGSVSCFKSPLANQSKEQMVFKFLVSFMNWPCKGLVSLVISLTGTHSAPPFFLCCFLVKLPFSKYFPLLNINFSSSNYFLIMPFLQTIFVLMAFFSSHSKIERKIADFKYFYTHLC